MNMSMGGYGMYVWSAYGITLMVFAIHLVLTLKEKRRVKKFIKDYLDYES